MASHSFRGSHDEIQIQVQSPDSLGCTNGQQIQASRAIRTFITKGIDAARHQARPHSCDVANARRRNDCRDHDGHGMAAAFGARLSCRRCSQETRLALFRSHPRNSFDPRRLLRLIVSINRDRPTNCPRVMVLLLSISVPQTLGVLRAQFVLFLERYPQVKVQNLYIRWLLRSQAYSAAQLFRASARW